MEFTLKIGLPEKLRSACLLIPVFDTGTFGTAGNRLDKALKGALSAVLQGGDIEGKQGESMVFPAVGGLASKRLLLAGCGQDGDLTETGFRKILQKACQVLRTTKATDVSILIEDFQVKDRGTEWLIQQVCEVFASGTYAFNQLKSAEKQTKIHLQKCQIILTDKASATKADKAIRHGQALADEFD